MSDRNHFAAVDLATLLYVGVMTAALLLFSDGGHTAWIWLLCAQVLLVALVLLAPRARAGEAGPLGRFIAEWYPMLLWGAFYAKAGVLNLDVGDHHDIVIQHLEQWVFGSQLSYRWIRAMSSPALSWLLHSCYMAYYGILIASPLGLWISGRREGARFTILAIALTFYVCGSVFVFFPVAGPRYAFPFPDNAATAVWPARAARWLLDQGDAWGSAFPSSHVAGAVVATLCALRFWRPLGLVLAPLTAGLVFGVVYGQFHYAVDALAGLVVAFAVMIAVSAAALRPTATLQSPPLRL